MSDTMRLAEIHRRHTEELGFAEMEGQHVELLPARTVLSMLKGNIISDIANNGDGSIAIGIPDGFTSVSE